MRKTTGEIESYKSLVFNLLYFYEKNILREKVASWKKEKYLGSTTSLYQDIMIPQVLSS